MSSCHQCHRTQVRLYVKTPASLAATENPVELPAWSSEKGVCLCCARKNRIPYTVRIKQKEDEEDLILHKTRSLRTVRTPTAVAKIHHPEGWIPYLPWTASCRPESWSRDEWTQWTSAYA